MISRGPRERGATKLRLETRPTVFSREVSKVPAVIRNPKTPIEFVRQKGLAKLIFPKISKILTNVVQLGPRVVLRSATQLLRVNPLTRIISVTSLAIIDVILLMRKKISRDQFLINLVYSLTMFFGSTLGWYTGSYIASQLALDVVIAFGVSLIFLLIGNTIADRLTRLAVSRVATTDCEKGLQQINEYCPHDVTIEVTKDQCIEAFRRNETEKTEYIRALIDTLAQEA